MPFDNAFSAEKDCKSMMFSYGDEDEKKGKGTMKSSGFLGFPSHVDVNEEAFKGSEPPQKKINLEKSSPAKKPEKDFKDEKESSSFHNPPQAGPSPKGTPTKSAAGASKIPIPPSAESEASSNQNQQLGSFLKETMEQLRSEVVLMVPEIRRQEEAGDGILARSARLGADIKVGESSLYCTFFFSERFSICAHGMLKSNTVFRYLKCPFTQEYREQLAGLRHQYTSRLNQVSFILRNNRPEDNK